MRNRRAQPDQPTTDTRHELRREEDRSTVEVLVQVSDKLNKLRPLWVLVAALGALLFSAFTWANVVRALPARITAVEARVDSNLGSIKALQQEAVEERRQNARKLNLLLRIECPRVANADLAEDCREFTRPVIPR